MFDAKDLDFNFSIIFLLKENSELELYLSVLQDIKVDIAFIWLVIVQK